MIIDKENLFSYKQAITVTADSSSVIDLGPPMWAGNSGNDKEIPIFIAIDEAFTADGSATLTIECRSSPVENFGSGVKTHQLGPAIPKAELAPKLKQTHRYNLPPDVQRYVKLVYTVATGPMTAGKITAGVTASRQTNG